MKVSRREGSWLRFAAVVVAAAAVAGVPMGGGKALAGTPPQPKKPLVLNIIDAGGAMAFTQEGFERYQKTYPNIVSRLAITKAPAPELPAKIKAMQDAKRVDIDLVVGGIGVMSNGVNLGLWEPLFPKHEGALAGILDSYLPPARKIQEMTKGNAVEVGFMYNGPLVMFNPEKAPKPPTTPQELLDWCKANPNRFLYARPANSGPGVTFIMGLPYILGDKDPMDPINGWDKTWAYLKELDKYVDYYPSGTGAVMKELGEGSRDMTITVTGWDINPRALGIVPKNYGVSFFKGMTFVNDSQFMMTPKGIDPERLEVVLHVMHFMMQPEQQALTWDKGYFYPGPAIKNVPLSMAPKASQDCINEYGRKDYETSLQDYPQMPPLSAQGVIDAYRKWDEEIGTRPGKK